MKYLKPLTFHCSVSTDPTTTIHIHTDFAAWARAADMMDVEVYSVEDDINTADIGSDIEFLRMDEIPEPSGMAIFVTPQR
jgi:hypothetical protein